MAAPHLFIIQGTYQSFECIKGAGRKVRAPQGSVTGNTRHRKLGTATIFLVYK